jgi:hypothetical protein
LAGKVMLESSRYVCANAVQSEKWPYLDNIAIAVLSDQQMFSEEVAEKCEDM